MLKAFERSKDKIQKTRRFIENKLEAHLPPRFATREACCSRRHLN